MKRNLGIEGVDARLFRLDPELESEIEIAFKRDKWTRGEYPKEYEYMKIFIYAKSFLYSLDTIQKLIKVLSEMKNVSEEVSVQLKIFKDTFPDLSGVRDSSQHIEDRARGLAKFSKPIDTKPLFVLNSLAADNFQNTMSDGRIGGIAVTPESLSKVQEIVQKIIDSFDWPVGSNRHYPS